jgi:large subunit ribosomal protein L16
MLIFPKKPKFVKTFSGKKLLPKTTNKNAKIRFGYYCLIAKESGFLTNFQMEAIRKLLRRSLRKRGQIFFKLFPSIPITKKPSETRLGRGKGKFKY